MKKKLKRFMGVLLAYLVLASLFYMLAGEQLRYKLDTFEFTDSPISSVEISNENVVKQEINIDCDAIQKISINFTTFFRKNEGNLKLALRDKETGVLLAEKKEKITTNDSDILYEWLFDEQISGLKGKTVELIISSDSQPGKGVGITVGTLKGKNPGTLYIGDKMVEGALGCTLVETTKSIFGMYYWTWVVLLLAIGIIYFEISIIREKKGKLTLAVRLTAIWKRYKYLIYQLVSRDFKTKYKRSVLGYLWSFLNPLLTMIVQYIVFSTIFRSNIENFQVYLLSGIVLFNFFTESVGQGLVAIVQNASLITKVYVPKYIYPVTKVISCSINLLISILPLFFVMLLTGQKFTKAVFLLPFPLICLLIFCIGLSLMLCSAMVFFRDTQYLWGLVSLAWTYATPIFYPAEIIPQKFVLIQKLNPMFHYIRFTRTLLISGTSPSSMEYLYCLIFAFAALIIGMIVFKKTQDKFILYI